MTLRFKTIKPGTLIVSKSYNIFKRLWYRMRKKELPYNCITLFTNTTSIFDTYSEKSTEILMELKKAYTKEELSLLTSLVEEYIKEHDITAVDFKGIKDMNELMKILNTIRPFSIQLALDGNDIFDKNKLTTRKNYYVKRIAEEKKWDICVY